MSRWVAQLALACAAAGSLPALAQQTGGLRLPSPAAPLPSLQAEALGTARADAEWSPWQGRVGLTAHQSLLSSSNWESGEGLKVQSMRLLGDYYFSPRSGFHATGGLLGGSLASPWAPAAASPGSGGIGLSLAAPRLGRHPNGLLLDDGSANSAVPYVGAGYSLAPERSRWRFNADIGVVALQPNSAVKLGRTFSSGTAALDDTLREMRLEPMLQLGVSYSF